MAEIGILHGSLESFPQAVLEALNSRRPDCCKYLHVDSLNLENPSNSGWDTPVVLDLYSRRLPFLNESLYLVWQFTNTKVLNEPRTLRLHNRATVRQIAKLAGFQTARARLFPARETFPPIPNEGFANLRYPVCWEECLDDCGPYPFLQSLSFNGVSGGLITDLGALWRRFNETGSEIQELISPPNSDRLFRLFFVGEVTIMRELDPLTRELLPSRSYPSSTSRPLLDAAKKLRKEVPLSICSFDFGLCESGVEYIDLNPDPELEWWNLGESDFERLVQGAVTLLEQYLPQQAPSKRKSSKKSRKKKGA